MTTSNNRKACKAFREIRGMKGPSRIDDRAVYWLSLPYEIRLRVARLAAGGDLK